MNLFEGITVIDFTINIAGPFATTQMADFGAEVVKIEKYGSGDDSRFFVPFAEGKSVSFMVHNRGKKSVELNLKTPEGVEIARKLVAGADVVVESFRPGVMEKMGLGYETLRELNPGLVMCSVSTFGQTGPYSRLPGYDIIAQAYSGIMSLTGDRDGIPRKVGPSIADYMGGANAFGAVSAALFHRERTGKGQYIDISLLDGLVAANDYYESAYLGYNAVRTGNHHSLIAPYGVFTGRCGSVVIGAINHKLWCRLTAAIGMPELAEDPRFSSVEKIIDHLAEAIEIIEGWLDTFESTEAPIGILKEAGVPCAPVLDTVQLADDPHLRARGMAARLRTPELERGDVNARGPHLKFSGCEARMGISPRLGENTIEILGKLGYSAGEISALRERKVCGYPEQG